MLALGYAITDAVCKRIAITVEHQPRTWTRGLRKRDAAGGYGTLHADG
ncbi:hypothetical protein FHY26_002379 [Xanthomonas campestris]